MRVRAEPERAFRSAEGELHQFERNLGKITDEGRVTRLVGLEFGLN